MIYLLLVLYQIKHFACDYPLQTPYMLGKFKGGRDWILPLLAHSGVHGLATLLIALCVNPHLALGLALFDMVVHFTMDRIKASPNLLGRFKALSSAEYHLLQNFTPYGGHNEFLKSTARNCDHMIKGNKYFWWSLGLDQGIHHLTHYAIIWMLLR